MLALPLLLSLLLALLSLLPSSTVSQSCSSVNVSFTSTPISSPIPSDFISFSIEVDVVLEWTGRSATTPRPQFTTLMKQLGRPTLRVGGDSTDYSWWNPTGRPYPPYSTRPFRYNITELDVHSIVNGVSSYGGQVVFGINFRDQGNPQWAVEHMMAIDQLVGVNNPAILAYEIGNEVSTRSRLQGSTRTPPTPAAAVADSVLPMRLCGFVGGPVPGQRRPPARLDATTVLHGVGVLLRSHTTGAAAPRRQEDAGGHILLVSAPLACTAATLIRVRTTRSLHFLRGVCCGTLL